MGMTMFMDSWPGGTASRMPAWMPRPSWKSGQSTVMWRPAGAAVRALAWIGPTHVSESVGLLRRTLPRSEWQALTSARATLPSWMAQAIGREAARG